MWGREWVGCDGSRARKRTDEEGWGRRETRENEDAGCKQLEVGGLRVEQQQYDDHVDVDSAWLDNLQEGWGRAVASGIDTGRRWRRLFGGRLVVVVVAVAVA